LRYKARQIRELFPVRIARATCGTTDWKAEELLIVDSGEFSLLADPTPANATG